jgi:streptomycin 6-kinase
MLPLVIPQKVRSKAASFGDVGITWLAELPQVILDFQHRWEIQIGQPYPNGTEAFVASARTIAGEESVIKIVMPGIDPARQEIRVLRAADGKGYARLLRADEDQNVLLIEKLGAQLHELRLSEDQQLNIICATLRQAWIPCSEPPPFATGADKAAEFAQIIESNWSALGRPCSERTVELALHYAEQRRRAFDPATSVLVHGDAHQWNTLCAPGSATGFKFIDPDGAYAERAFDLAIPMREWGSVVPSGDLLELGRRRCRTLAQFSGVDENAIWQWGLIQCVWNGMLLLHIGADDSAAVEFRMADAWAGEGAGVTSR